MSRPATSTHSRLIPEDRKILLIEATLRCLRAYGLQGTSMRKVAEEAGVSPGLIIHHFKSKDELVAGAYQHLTQRTLDHIRHAVNSAGPQPRSRLEAYCHAYLGDHEDAPTLLDYWIAFWGAVRTHAVMQRVHDTSYDGYRALLEENMATFARAQDWRQFDTARAASVLGGLLDGLWLAAGLNSQGASVQDGMSLCVTWLDSLIQGGYRAYQTNEA